MTSPTKATMTTADKRTYLVVDKTNGIGRLIKTNSKTRATEHVIGDRFTTRVATQDDLIIAMTAGIKPEELADPAPKRRADDKAATGGQASPQ